jgi:hypothetical protein
MLLYFDIFQYPLNKSELSLVVNDPIYLDEYLDELKESGIITQEEEWYYLSGRKYVKRISEKSTAERAYKKAEKYAALINRFPFVRGVYVSGSLSKDWADETTDVDYFILFKKLFLLNSRKYFCLNYFIDTSHLEIEEKNIFTATEIKFLKPMVNYVLYDDLLARNKWVDQFYSSRRAVDYNDHEELKDGWMKRVGEKILGGKLGERLDIWSMKKTLKFWRNKFPEMTNQNFAINFKSNRSISKHHPNGFQKKVIDALHLRVKEFEKDTQISLQ